MTAVDALDRGRVSFARQAWGEACAMFASADQESPLDPADVERFATAAYLVGRDEDSADLWERAHREFLNRGEAERAARCAFWLGFGLLLRGEMARAAGWLARAGRMLDESGGRDCVERGYLLVPAALECLGAGDAARAYETFDEAARIGDRFRDPDLMTLGRLGCGQALIVLGETAEAVRLLDEIMVAVTSGEVSAIVAGLVYCAVIEACQEIFDLRRAQEWTAALSHWCAAQPQLMHYRGQCLVHRAEIMRLHGAWPDAIDEAQLACQRLAEQPAVGTAFYTIGDLYRLRGEFAKAEAAYRQASQWGREPQPGLAQLRLAQGRIDAAQAAIRRVLDEAVGHVRRCNVLPAYVEIMLRAQDIPAARAAVDELSQIAGQVDAPLLQAAAAQAHGAVLLGEDDPRGALAVLREAWTLWRQIDAPYEARVRVLVGLACRALGDEDTAQMELDAARWVFRQLGAGPDDAGVEELTRRKTPTALGGLTAREAQVLCLVAAGKTNRAIATELFLSEKTVARHVSKIFTKLGLSSRSAATAYAYEHGFV